jgi:uncharacterized membrane protein
VQAVAFFFHEKAWDRAARRRARDSALAHTPGAALRAG